MHCNKKLMLEFEKKKKHFGYKMKFIVTSTF